MPTATAAPRGRVDYSQVDAEIIARLDLREFFQRLGVTFTRNTPTPDGWLECRAIGREDAKPSAGCHLATGRYKDFARGENVSLWEFAAAHGGPAYGGGDWRAARDAIAREVGVSLPEAGGGETAFKALSLSGWNAAAADMWCQAKGGGLTPDALRAAGGMIGRYRNRYSVVAVPVVGPSLSREKPIGWIVWEASGRELPVFTKGSPEPVSFVKMKTLGGSKRGLIVLGNPAAPVAWKVEGPTDAMALWSAIPEANRHEHCVITNSDGAAGHPDPWRVGVFTAASHVFVIGDADEPGQAGAGRWAKAIASTGRNTRIVPLPFAVTGAHGRDIRDYLADHSFAELVALTADAPPVAAGPPPRPAITITPELTELVDAAIDALEPDDNLYQRGGELVYIVCDELPPSRMTVSGPTPRCVPLSLPGLRERMARAADWLLPPTLDKPPKKIHPPELVAKTLAARGQWQARKIRPIDSIVESPIIRPDGSILQSPGYDAATGIVYLPSAEFPAVPEAPTRDEARDAVFRLLEIVCDFPFDGLPGRSAWLAALLTPFSRYIAPGPAPLFLIDANVPGAGKGLIADTVSVVFSGRQAAVKGCPGDDAEWEKFITSIAIAGFPLVLIDNIVGSFGSQHLDAVLTGSEWSGRILGKSETKRFHLATTWFATGNNLTLRGDLPRRVLPIRLVSAHENPEERSDLTHPDLIAWLKANRPGFVADALTILRGYIVAGRPSPPPPWGSFTAWSDLIRGAILWLGMPDPYESKASMASQTEADRDTLARLLDAWQALDPNRIGMTAAEAIRAINARTEQAAQLQELLEEIMTTITPKSLGRLLMKFRQRVSGGRRFDFSTGMQSKKTWKIIKQHQPHGD